MNGQMQPALLPRERLVLFAALALLTLLAWVYLFRISAHMAAPGMAMPGMGGRATTAAMTAATPARAAWSAADFALAWIMWAVMMVGMMTPSAAPMLLTHALVARDAARRGRRFASTAWFGAGYLLAWAGFSLFAAAAQGGFQRAGWLTPMLAPARPALAALVLIAAGVYQFSSLKAACLSHCRAPMQFLQHHGGFRAGAAGSLALGVRHGLYCVGCCWALMALLFAVGVMNLIWVAAIAAFVLIEKASPAGPTLARLGGLACAAWGLALLLPVGAQASPRPKTPPQLALSLPVRIVPTDDGADREFAYPPTVAVTVPAALAHEIAAYGAAGRVWFGPINWSGTAGAGADNSTGVILLPAVAAGANRSAPFHAELPAPARGPYVEYSDSGGCVGCAISAAAAFFPEARKQAGLLFRSDPAPHGLRIRSRMRNFVRYSLPPLGELPVRGGAYWLGGSDAYFAQARFVLPKSQFALEQFLEDHFIASCGDNNRDLGGC